MPLINYRKHIYDLKDSLRFHGLAENAGRFIWYLRIKPSMKP